MPLKILIVEDEPLLAMDLESQIEALGQKVVGVAEDAGAALALANRASPDLALVDVNLRDGRTGPQVASELVKKHNVVVVFVTGSSEELPPDRAGALGVIPKPWKRETIEKLIPFVRSLCRAEPPPPSLPPYMEVAASFR